MPGAFHLAVCFYTDPASATQQFFLMAEYICDSLTSDRDNESVFANVPGHPELSGKQVVPRS